MKSFLEKYGFYIAVITIILYQLYIVQKQNMRIESYNVSQNMLQGGDIKKAEYIDSISAELFIATTIIDRYEIALENLRIEDSVAAQKFDKELSRVE